ncbi:hypothetical protein D9C73_026648 [Collichthys lucidus]|uniref:Uncharacterized protein n=1 Tax=Collichthys lucidus TaxID=240159 RepID=A0A4U5VWX9_COLLU|nr:hypothetical protein D9C73_026648 [Collichthys lucidus]
MWWRAGILSDPGDPLSEYRFVHMYRDIEDMKMESYAGRTTLDKDGLKHGNILLKITNTPNTNSSSVSSESRARRLGE